MGDSVCEFVMMNIWSGWGHIYISRCVLSICIPPPPPPPPSRSSCPPQAESYWSALLDWVPPARTMAAAQAAARNITCDADALFYACHLAPWGLQSFDDTIYMAWNGHFSTLLFINHWEYTLNASFAGEVIAPLLHGHNLWWACYLNKTVTGPGPDDYVYHDSRGDAEHEGQVRRNAW